MLSGMLKPLKLAEVAKHVNVSKVYLSRIFHEETGVTFKEYLNGLRCEYAKRLLEENNQPIINVCYESGFNSLSQFMRAFRKYSGFSPAQYRKMCKS